MKNEAVWVLANCTSRATAEQGAYLVREGAFNALSACLDISDPQGIIVTLEGIKFLLQQGTKHALTETGENGYAMTAEDAGVLDKLESL